MLKVLHLASHHASYIPLPLSQIIHVPTNKHTTDSKFDRAKCQHALQSCRSCISLSLGHAPAVVFLYPRQIVTSTGTWCSYKHVSHRLHIGQIGHRQCWVPTVSVRCVRACVVASTQRRSFFSPKYQPYIASFCIGDSAAPLLIGVTIDLCEFHAETNEDECVSRLARLHAALPRFRQRRVAQTSSEIRADIIDRRRLVLVRYPSCGDGTSQPSWVAALCFILS